MERQCQVATITVKNRLAPLHQRHLQVVILQHLDQRSFEPRYLEPVPDTSDNSNWINLRPYVVEQTADEPRFRFRIRQQVFPQVLVILLLGKVDGLRWISRSTRVQVHFREGPTDPLHIA